MVYIKQSPFFFFFVLVLFSLSSVNSCSLHSNSQYSISDNISDTFQQEGELNINTTYPKPDRPTQMTADLTFAVPSSPPPFTSSSSSSSTYSKIYRAFARSRPTSRRSSAGSTSSAVSTAESISSAASAASKMSVEEMDNFRSMRGKSGFCTTELASHMLDDTDSLSERLLDVQSFKEIEKRLLDTTGEAYNILVTSDCVRLCHLDERGNYRYLYFASYASNPASIPSPPLSPVSSSSSTESVDIYPTADAQVKSYNRNFRPVKQYWHIMDNDFASMGNKKGHIFIDISPSFVTVYHAHGTWECRRSTSDGRIYEVRDSSVYDSRLGGFGQRQRKRARLWYLYNNDANNNESTSDASDDKDAAAVELKLASNSPSEKGVHHTAFKSFYHDL